MYSIPFKKNNEKLQLRYWKERPIQLNIFGNFEENFEKGVIDSAKLSRGYPYFRGYTYWFQLMFLETSKSQSWDTKMYGLLILQIFLNGRRLFCQWWDYSKQNNTNVWEYLAVFQPTVQCLWRPAWFENVRQLVAQTDLLHTTQMKPASYLGLKDLTSPIFSIIILWGIYIKH